MPISLVIGVLIPFQHNGESLCEISAFWIQLGFDLDDDKSQYVIVCDLFMLSQVRAGRLRIFRSLILRWMGNIRVQIFNFYLVFGK